MNADALVGLTAAGAAGMGLGGAYCAMLWLAVSRVRAARRPALWLFATALPRIAVPLAGFFWVMDERWERLAGCVAGFVLARLLIQQWVKGGTAARANAP